MEVRYGKRLNVPPGAHGGVVIYGPDEPVLIDDEGFCVVEISTAEYPAPQTGTR